MMNLRKVWGAALALCVTAGLVSAEPIRTLFTKENKFPEAMGWELFLAGGASSLDDDDAFEDADTFFVAPGARFGVTDRVAVWAAAPFVSYSAGDLDEQGLGDAQLGLEFLFFEDIFEYAWIIPHVTGIFPTGDEDDGLGTGETQGRFGVSIGTTVNDVVHFAVDASYTANGAAPEDEFSDDRDELLAGALSIVWDLDERASLLGEAQIRDDPVDPEDDFAFRGHVGLAYKVNQNVSFMLYGGGASGTAEDIYGQGRLVYSF